MRALRSLPLLLAFLAVLTGPAEYRLAAEESVEGDRLPKIELEVTDGKTGEKHTLGTSLKVVVLMTLLSLAPTFLVMMTSFTRIIIVLGFVRHALSTQQIPPNIVLIGLSIMLTVFLMAPVWERVKTDAYDPFMAGKLDQDQAVERGLKPLREFMGRQTRKKDLQLFIALGNHPEPERFEDVRTTALVPAFVVSELRTAFQMGFLIFLPFIIIDLVVASVLMSLGMVMLPPAMIAMPIKLLLFVLADGWHLIVQSLIVSFQAAG
jgi:flagellar biosynthetic protein FliP